MKQSTKNKVCNVILILGLLYFLGHVTYALVTADSIDIRVEQSR